MTDFFLKIYSPSAGRNSGDSAYPCYSTVSFIDEPFTNYFPFATPTTSFSGSILSGQTLYQATPLENNTSLLQHFTVESSWELVSSKEYGSAGLYAPLSRKGLQETKQELLFRSNQDQLSSNLCVGVCAGDVSAPLRS